MMKLKNQIKGARAWGGITYDYVDPLKGLGNLDKITHPNGTSTSFGWHGSSHQGRLKEIIQRFTLPQGGGGAARNAYGYAPGGELRSWTREEGAGEPVVYAPGEQWAVEHDQADQLRSVVVRGTGPGRELRRQFYYSYDKAGNRISSQVDHGVMPFEYNAVNQKVGTFGSSGTGLVRFEGTLEEPGVVDIRGVKARTRTVADEAGSPEFRFSADVPLELEDNRVRVSALGDNGQRAQKDYDVYILGQGGIGLPSYDSRGNMTGNGLNQGYEWDAASRLSAITYADGTRTEFGYDALGRRARVLERAGVAVQEKRLLWCGWEICQERDGGNAVVRRYGRHGFMDKDGVKRYYGRDHLGSVTQLLDEGGRVVERYSYDPYGVQPQEVEGSQTTRARSDMRYTGHYYHAKSGLHLAPYRAYDAKQGVWLSEDPIGEAGGINLYGYVGGSPVMAVDPLGFIDISPSFLRMVSSTVAPSLSKPIISDALNNAKFASDFDPGGKFGSCRYVNTKKGAVDLKHVFMAGYSGAGTIMPLTALWEGIQLISDNDSAFKDEDLRSNAIGASAAESTCPTWLSGKKFGDEATRLISAMGIISLPYAR